DAKAYPDIEEFWSDIARAYREEIRDLVAAGCSYLQIDDVSFACLCDEAIRAQVKRDGEDPAKLPSKYAAVINSFLENRPGNLAVTMHTCRGNHASMWMASGGYDAVAEAVFGEAQVDGFFLEYDTGRAGGFEPLRFVPRGRKVVLGLISTKKKELEDKDKLKRRIDDAGIQMENGARTYVKQHGDTLAGRKIEIIRRDVGGPLPDVAKRHAQELVVRDKVDLLAGFLLTPNALAAADVSAEAKKFMVVMNAATSIIISKSPYMVRTSVTLPQVMETFGTWAVKNGI